MLEGCFQLLSLFFMTIGRTSEAPPAYALTSTIKRLLDHLTEARLFSAKDLESMHQTLGKLSVTVANTDSRQSPYLVELLSHRVERCQKSLANLQMQLDRLGDSLPAVHEKLISILRSISLANTRRQFSTADVQKLRAKLKEIDEQRVDGKFVTVDGKVCAGSDELSELLQRCLMWSDIVLERYGSMLDSETCSV